MQRFRYRLQKLLELAARRAEMARRDAGRALTEASRAEEIAAESRAARAAADEDIAKLLLRGAVEPSEILRRHGHLTALDRAKKAAEVRAEAAQRAYEAARVIAIEKRKDELLLARAREVRLEVWKEETKKVELEFMEETASVRWLRNANAKKDRQ